MSEKYFRPDAHILDDVSIRVHSENSHLVAIEKLYALMKANPSPIPVSVQDSNSVDLSYMLSGKINFF